MNGDVFPKAIVGADHDSTIGCRVEAEVLRLVSQNCARAYLAIFAQDQIPQELGVARNLTTGRETHSRFNDGIGADFNTGVDLGGGVDDRGGMDVHVRRGSGTGLK